MQWKHIVLEGYCVFGMEGDKQEIPKCCKDKPYSIGLHCLNYEEKKYCPYFAFGTARSSIVVTDKNGDAIGGTCFFPQDAFKLSEEQWNVEENKWINKWAERINREKDD